MAIGEDQDQTVLMRRAEGRVVPEKAQKAFDRGLELLASDQLAEAVSSLKEASEAAPDHARIRSYLGLAIARAEGDFERAKALCESAAKQEFFNPEHYLNMARVFLLFERRAEALRFLRRGQMIDPGQSEIRTAMESLGRRRLPVLPFLPRRHPINRRLGSVRSLIEAGRGRRGAAV